MISMGALMHKLNGDSMTFTDPELSLQRGKVPLRPEDPRTPRRVRQLQAPDEELP
jgi:hypothetical protein